jgi:hypothetical protein
VALEEPTQRTIPDHEPIAGKTGPHLIKRGVWLVGELGEDRRCMRFDPAGPAVAATWSTGDVRVVAFELAPAADAGGTDTEALTNRAVAKPFAERTKNPNTKIKGKRLGHVCRLQARQTA